MLENPCWKVESGLCTTRLRGGCAIVCRVQRMLRSFGLAAVLSLVVPAIAGAAEKTDLGEEKVTQAMFVLIFVLILLLGIAVAVEQRGKGH